MAKNKKGRSKPSRPPRQQKPQQGRRNGAPVENSTVSHLYGGSTAYVPTSRLPIHGSMVNEVRNTLFHRREFSGRGDSRLRHQPVVFVSAGLMDPLKDFEVTLDVHVKKTSVSASTPQAQVDGTTAALENSSPAETPRSSDPSPNSVPAPVDKPSFVIDITGDKSLRPGTRACDAASQQGDTGSESDSSEDVILFKGRDQARQTPSRPGTVSTPVAMPLRSDSLDLPELTIELDHIDKNTLSEALDHPIRTPRDCIPSRASSSGSLKAKPAGFLALTGANKGSRRGKPSPAPPGIDMADEEAAIIADYIANMRDEDDSDENAADVHPGLGSHAFHLLRDLGGSDSDAVPARGLMAESSNRSSETDEDDNDDDEVDETALRQHAESQDARLARLLAKQEELGLGGEDIVLFDDADSDGENLEGWQIAPKHTPRRRKKGGSKQARIVQQKGQYPSASRMADAFDDLDLMDWHRPSLNNFKSIGKRQEPTFDLSDSDLEEAMAIAWKKDRLRKAEKKKAREELRSQGLLGKHANPEDLKIKYRGGMSIDDIEVEFEAFLMGPREQLHLPPFDKKSRQTVHLIANKFKIKSQSAGKGNMRCPVLYRTKATLPYEPDFFNNVFSRIKQSWFPRVDVDDQIVSDAKIFRARSDVGAARARKRGVVHLREGEVVGQHASELGVDNKGRAMLEKMGWSKGMALGTDDNRGIIVPITHVVKKGKAGLGDL
ncbi:uncharacterized protein B0I36DRAFT_423025 [Microdochium trichocladiopsis]|uniref:Protein SQS1 n=1 Tax=Microdochium trichocladiopsis TaxID=1682393 RepID=A0A9P8Y4S7_9PEZI|nr:uncharacterized protein B0I36DRAFT_423025 [Microdochium trichocladiopsis]KAH7029359.1 hypothetical protein B0I36DRAFT_423025 [Microdochium trichocladiopsis]